MHESWLDSWFKVTKTHQKDFCGFSDIGYDMHALLAQQRLLIRLSLVVHAKLWFSHPSWLFQSTDWSLSRLFAWHPCAGRSFLPNIQCFSSDIPYFLTSMNSHGLKCVGFVRLHEQEYTYHPIFFDINACNTFPLRGTDCGPLLSQEYAHFPTFVTSTVCLRSRPSEGCALPPIRIDINVFPPTNPDLIC